MKNEISPQNKWQKCLEILRNNVASETFDAFFAPMKFETYSREGRTLLLQLPSIFIYEYVEEHFANMMSKVLMRVFGHPVTLKYRLLTDSENKISQEVVAEEQPAIPPTNIRHEPQYSPSVLDAVSMQEIDSQLTPMHTFNNFIEGDSNKFARTIGLSIAEHPKTNVFNPLFIFGPSGCGKTHLINAIGIRAKELYPEMRILYVSARLFQVQYSNAVLENKVNDFIFFYQTIDLLIVDDVQEWISAKKTQDAFFHIFNHLTCNGRRIVLACDRPPVELTGLNERLISRFKSGAVIELEKPNVQLCKDILNAKIRRDGLDIPEDVVDYIANTANGSVRDLEGVISSLMAYSVVYNSRIDMKLAERIVRRSVKTDNNPLTIDDIIRNVANSFDIKEENITGKSRQKNYVEARQTAIYLTHKHTKMPAKRIGKLIGGRDHTTILYSCNKVEERLSNDTAFAQKVKEIEESFGLRLTL